MCRLVTRLVRHVLDLDGLEQFMADYLARVEAYEEE